MEAGKLNRRIQIQSQTTSVDPRSGQPLPTWSTLYTCWASIGVQGSQLLYSTSEFMSRVASRIEMRWTSSVIISAKQRVVSTEPTTGVVHTYVIEAVLNDQ